MQNTYLPNETPPVGRLFLYAIQQIIVMFPATITVALVTGFPVSTTLFSCGLATICCTMITKRRIPLFYGASFAYMSAILALVNSMGFSATNGVLPREAIQIAQFGIIASGFVSLGAGLLVHYAKESIINLVLPPHVTGAVSIIVGLSLAGNAIDDLAPKASSPQIVWIVGICTFAAVVIFASFTKGIMAQIPLLFGVIAGCIVAFVLKTYCSIDLFRTISNGTMNESSGLFTMRTMFALPDFTLPRPSLGAVFAIMPMAIATIPESVSHVYQLDIYINDLAQKKGKPETNIRSMLDISLIGDGVGDIVAGLIGGPAGTSYGENISVMTISGVFSTAVLLASAVLIMVVSCISPIIRFIYSIPLEVIGGLELYMFGAISVQGIAIMIENQTDVFDIRVVSVISSILIIGLGGTYHFNGSIPFFGISIPAIAGASAVGIVLNAVLFGPGIIRSSSK